MVLDVPPSLRFLLVPERIFCGGCLAAEPCTQIYRRGRNARDLEAGRTRHCRPQRILQHFLFYWAVQFAELLAAQRGTAGQELHRLVHQKCTSSTPGSFCQEIRSAGLVPNHAYSLIDATATECIGVVSQVAVITACRFKLRSEPKTTL